MGDLTYFNKYNQQNIQTKNYEHLLGMAEMALSDGKIDQNEAETLHCTPSAPCGPISLIA